MEASGQTGPAEGTGSMPEGEVSGAMTAPVAETTPVVLLCRACTGPLNCY